MSKFVIALATISLVGASAVSVASAAPQHRAAKARDYDRTSVSRPVGEFTPWGYEFGDSGYGFGSYGSPLQYRGGPKFPY